MTVHIITTADEFYSAIQNNKIVIVDCAAERCPPCRTIFPVFEEASNVDGIKDSVYFIKYNVDEIIEISKMLKLRQTPSFVAFKDGERVDQLVGGDDPTALKAFIKGIAA